MSDFATEDQADAAPAGAGAVEPAAYACDHCGTVVFTEDRVLDRRPLWDLGEYASDCFLISEPHDWSAFRRYDTSLHEGWYCCRFILMRMTHDKFATGDHLIVYADSVHRVEGGKAVTPPRDPLPAVRLGAGDFDAVLSSPERADRLALVKFGAIWCPPCRLMDDAIARLVKDGGIDGVDFFEVDIDEEPGLDARFPNQSIPFTVFYHRGRRVPVRSRRLHVLDGGVVGGLGRVALARLLTAARDQLAAGRTEVEF